MSQRPKDEVYDRICAAALRVFAERGYAGAAISAIALRAGISTGNIYIYFKGKAELFRAVVPDDFVAALGKRVLGKVKALDGASDIRSLEPDAPYHVLGEDLVRWSIENRERVLIALGRADGTPYEGFAEKTIRQLVRLAIGRYRRTGPGVEVSAVLRFALHEIYRNFVSAMVNVLATFHDETRIRAVVGKLSTYHLTGLQRLLENPESP